MWTRLQPMLRGPESRVLAVSTPGGRLGWFYAAFTAGTREFGTFDEAIAVTLADCPHLKELAAREAKRLGRDTALYMQQMEGEFANAGASSLFPMSLLEACRRDPDGPEPTHWIEGPPRERFGGFDPAGLGENDSVMVMVVGRCVKQLRVLRSFSRWHWRPRRSSSAGMAAHDASRRRRRPGRSAGEPDARPRTEAPHRSGLPRWLQTVRAERRESEVVGRDEAARALA